MARRSSITLLLMLLAIIAWPVASRSCGPYFPNTLLDDRDRAMLRAPIGDFELEMKRIRPATSQPFRENDLATSQADLADLGDALAKQHVPPAQRQAIIRDYTALRATIDRHLMADGVYGHQDLSDLPGQMSYDKYHWADGKSVKETIKLAVLGEVAIPPGLPGEFDDYIRGAVAYHQGKIDQARTIWQKLLARPAAERHYRSTWAAFMLARTYVKADPDKCVDYCRQAAALAKDGFADSAALASGALGLAGRVELERENFEKAIELYLEQQAAGNQSASRSLRTVVWRILEFDDNDVLQRVSRDAKTCQVLAAYMVSGGGRFDFHDFERSKGAAWLKAVEAANLKDLPGADRMAWAAYRLGQYDAAKRWLDRAKPQTPVAQWVQAKLLLRAGKLDEAATILAKLTRALPANEEWADYGSTPASAEETDSYQWNRTSGLHPAELVAGELAVLKLARAQYVDALDLLLRNNWWTDAAYVAECVCTADELKEYVDKHWPAELAAKHKPDADDPGVWAWPGDTETEAKRRLNLQIASAYSLRYLLARRLVRLNRLAEAKAYFPANLVATFEEYVTARAAANDRKLSDFNRGKAMWKQAKLTRYKGMELMGTELSPDGHIYGGAFPVRLSRFDARPWHGGKDDDPARGKFATRDEHDRMERSKPAILKRFHYRYIAIDLAWRAAEMLPDQDDLTARALAEGGLWLANSDPKGADKFYKALARRCSQTALGKQANEHHWFPPLPKE